MTVFYSLPEPSRRPLMTRLRPPMLRIGRAMRLALKTMHRAIVTAKQRRLARELLLRDLNGDHGEFPRAPMILGDKWDF